MKLVDIIESLHLNSKLSDADLEKACLECFNLISSPKKMLKIEKEIISLCDYER